MIGPKFSIYPKCNDCEYLTLSTTLQPICSDLKCELSENLLGELNPDKECKFLKTNKKEFLQNELKEKSNNSAKQFIRLIAKAQLGVVFKK